MAALESRVRIDAPCGMRNPWLDIPLQDYEGHMALPSISPSPFTSLQRLSPLMTLVDPAEFSRHAADAGFMPDAPPGTIDLPFGKRFLLQTFRAR